MKIIEQDLINLNEQRQVFKIVESGAIVQVGGGIGDMTKAVYDPGNVNGDAFDMDNMSEGAANKILSSTNKDALDNSQSPSGSNPVMTENVGVVTLVANRSTILTDRDKLINNIGVNNYTYTLENTMPVGFSGEAWQESTGTITYSAGSGVTVVAKDNNLKTNGVGSASTFRKVRDGVYYVTGDLVA